MNNYKVYTHISPSNKRYIGITKLKQNTDGIMEKDIKKINIFLML